jgi:enoyl-CoA hydratase
MGNFVLLNHINRVAIVTLNRPEVLNAWHAPMRQELVATLNFLNANSDVRAIVITGAGTRAFCAGQDLNEAKSFDANSGSEWIREWELLYSTIRSITKPLIAALNGVAAGSAFQVALLCDFRIGHPDIRMGQPEINSGIASVTGPWLMREILGIARTTDLTLTGRLMDASECLSIGILNKIVPEDQVLESAVLLAQELAEKPPIAMRLDKQWLREMTEQTFRLSIEAAIKIHREAFSSGEPSQMMNRFFNVRLENNND